MKNLAETLPAAASERPNAVAIKLDDYQLTYAQFEEASQRLAGFLLAQGVKRGDRVALSLANVPAQPIAVFAILRIGAILVPMNPLFTSREVEYYIQDAGISYGFCMTPDFVAAAKKTGTPFTMVGADQLAELLAEQAADSRMESMDGNDTALILYTSGTTGRPKGAELTHTNMHLNWKVAADQLMSITADDVIMGCLPLFHVFGFTCALMATVGAQCTLTLIPRFDGPKALSMLKRDEVTIFIGVPTMYQGLLMALGENEAEAPNLRICISGGASMPVEVMRKFENRFDCIILEGYGLSETSPIASFNLPELERKPGSIGVPVQGVEMKLVNSEHSGPPAEEIGEIAIRGHNIMKGYWKRPDATAEAIDSEGWFFSGDLARQDEEGYFYIVDRSKDMINRGGLNVYPREVEEVLYEHPDIVEVAIVGIPDDYLGEEIAAFVVTTEGSDLDSAGVQAFARERVAPYKYPRKVDFIRELPKGATGKILKRELRDM